MVRPPSTRFEGCVYTQYENLNVYGKFRLDDGSGGGAVFPTVTKTVDADYSITDEDASIRVTGARTITLQSERSFPVRVYAADSTVTLSEAPENQPATITAGLAYTLVYDSTLGGYYVS